MKSNVAEDILCLFFPDRCLCCGKVVGFKEKYCADCRESLPRIKPPLCLYCGASVEDCRCEHKRSHYERCIAPFYYDGGIREGLKSLKFYGKSARADGLAEEMAAFACEVYGENQFDLAVCVPMTRKQLKQRSYNQSALLAEKTARLLGVPFSRRGLIKIFDNNPQHSLPSGKRGGNVAGVFECGDGAAVRGRHILLIDDIKTTGATLNECAKMLILAGAKSVSCLCCAVVRRESPKD